MSQLWNDQRGGIITTELVLVLSLVSAGVISGWTSVRNSVVSEANDIAHTVSSLSQSHGITGVSGPSAATQGSQFVDQPGIAFHGIVE